MKTLLITIAILIVAALGVIAYTTYHKQNSTPVTKNPNTKTMEEKTMEPTANQTEAMTLTSPAFQDNGSIPAKYTCDVDAPPSPPLSITGIPEGAVSLALTVHDPDVPKVLVPEGVFNHWVLFNIPPSITEIPEGQSLGTLGSNGAGKQAYAGPCPPPQYEPSEHRYIFSLYALDTKLDLEPGATKEQLLAAMQGHIVTQTQLTGRYKKQETK